MKLTLMIEGSADTIAAVLAALPKGHEYNINGAIKPGNVLPTITTNTGAASLPASSAPIPNAADDDDDDAGTPSDAATDSTGLPWDERIHAGSKTQTAKGVWKKRKGVDDATMAAVEAELRGAPQQPASAVPQQPVAMPMMPAMQQPTPQPVAMPMPTMAPVPQPMPPQQPMAMPTAPTGPTFPEFMQKMAELTGGPAPKVTAENIQWLAQQIGVNALTDLSVQPDKIGEAISLLRQYELWTD